MSAIIAAAVYITTDQTTVQITGRRIFAFTSCRNWLCLFARAGIDGVPLQIRITILEFIGNLTLCVLDDLVISISFNHPAFRLNLQSLEVQFQFVAVGISSTKYTTLIRGVIIRTGYIGIIAAAHHFIINNDLVIKVDRYLSFPDQTTSVTTTVQ